ncbi:MAG TPA: hypothetical protein VE465_01935 [Streptosporangiaceae bacterium]|jgi:hypothetical protein|nr:hypothetical protein [Streptosporangiaceae bacterium]
MSAGWLTATISLPTVAVLALIAGGAVALASLGWQTWRCSRRHADIDDTEPTAWDDQPPATTATPDHDAARAAS